MSKAQLQRAIQAVNNRYAKGLNDDDQVFKMCQIAKKTKGYHFLPKWETYELTTDLEYLQHLTKKYGYWSEQLKAFNEVLTNKGGYNYMTDLNSKVLAEQKQLS